MCGDDNHRRDPEGFVIVSRATAVGDIVDGGVERSSRWVLTQEKTRLDKIDRTFGTRARARRRARTRSIARRPVVLFGRRGGAAMVRHEFKRRSSRVCSRRARGRGRGRVVTGRRRRRDVAHA